MKLVGWASGLASCKVQARSCKHHSTVGHAWELGRKANEKRHAQDASGLWSLAPCAKPLISARLLARRGQWPSGRVASSSPLSPVTCVCTRSVYKRWTNVPHVCVNQSVVVWEEPPPHHKGKLWPVGPTHFPLLKGDDEFQGAILFLKPSSGTAARVLNYRISWTYPTD